MPVVFIPTLLQAVTGGHTRLEAEGSTVAQVIENLDRDWPGIAARLVEGARLRPNLSVAVDGEITPLGLLERVGPQSEVHFVAAIKGGSGWIEADRLLHAGAIALVEN
ncbi:MAG: MoaD/ThiS family protein [Acidobacteriia bacterium]|nr:MoaD/ThiS family protein [Terriglobia bacterium]